MTRESIHGDGTEMSARLAIYQIAQNQWEHAEQLRWTVLYNFLVASTILLLAWGAVFGTAPGSSKQTYVLMIFCFVGGFVSIFWVALVIRANRFVKYHSIKAQELEASLPHQWRLFGAVEAFRNGLEGFEGWISTRRAVLFIPSTFFLMFVILGCLSMSTVTLLVSA
jgi:hypothetical protein